MERLKDEEKTTKIHSEKWAKNSGFISDFFSNKESRNKKRRKKFKKQSEKMRNKDFAFFASLFKGHLKTLKAGARGGLPM